MISFLLSVRRSYRIILAMVYVLCIVALSLLPPNDLPNFRFFNGFDKVVHFLMYLPLSALLCWIFKVELANYRVFFVVGIAVLWGLFMEFMQLEMHMGRSFSWYDELANFTGVATGAFLYWLVTRRFVLPENNFKSDLL